MSWNEPKGRFSSNFDGTISGARPWMLGSKHMYDQGSELGRTNVRSISCLRGLADAKITRLPASFLMLGVCRACVRTALFFSDILEFTKPVEDGGGEEV